MMNKIYFIQEQYDVCEGYEKAYIVCEDLGFFTDKKRAEGIALEHATKAYTDDLELIKEADESVRNIAKMLLNGQLTFEEDERGCTVRFDPTDKQLVSDACSFGNAIRKMVKHPYDSWSNDGVVTIIDCSAEEFLAATKQTLEDSFSVQHITLEEYVKKYVIVELSENGNGEAVE